MHEALDLKLKDIESKFDISKCSLRMWVILNPTISNS